MTTIQVKEKQIKKVSIHDIKIGDFFLYYGEVYIKLPILVHNPGTVNAMRMTDQYITNVHGDDGIVEVDTKIEIKPM